MKKSPISRLRLLIVKQKRLPALTIRNHKSQIIKSFLIAALLVLPLAILPARGHQPSGLRFTDVTERAGITFKHVSTPEKRYIVESMSGGVALIDYDNDGLPDIYFVNSLTVDLVKSKGKTKSALYRNRGDGTFSDVTEKAGVGDIGWGMGAAVADYNN